MQEQKTTNHEKRLLYCRWFNRFIEKNKADVLDTTFFSDEAWFHLSGYVNSQNSRLWSSDNPHSLHETLLHDKKVGVWVAISRCRIVGPIFFMNTINSERYCSDILHAFIVQMTSDEINYSWFQQNGATAHTPGRFMDLLKEFFGDRIISKDVWPPRSPDLNPPNFLSMGAAKSAVYRNRPRTLGDLQAVITAFIQSISSEQLIAVFRNKIRRVQACIDAKGVTFNIIYNCHSYLPPVFYIETCMLINT